ncbi:MAG: GntR family transcriptional regulator [Sphaerochaeta sp.]|jgi:DNA-binding FadR family transcriptional regulator|nr:GntR family transcriptional regulator [Sphaerochaeta sp.]MCH3920622.1 GntR family transcriptional regulator [Sphaerochaeta sp.]MCI2076636.1 GntR family transcriptional regulator [Sphaerochaeta sp.]MCI2097682.1 GntR family transcriptional regulator [Sphaerochaeta sp.]MCI2105031.1 GntR family transcriptional regulator [Sphaerochaeta sp.]
MITPLTTETKSTAIANKLEEMILAKKYKAGEALPSQHELALQFSASSRSVREAFKNLEAKGLIQVSQGKKAIVKSNSLDQFVESLSMSMISKQAPDKKLISDLLQVRTTIEVSAARELSREPNRMLVVRSLARCASKMEQLLPQLENGKDPEALKQFKQLDFEFHTTLIRSNDNVILNSIYENLAPQLYNVIDRTAETFAEQKKKVNEYNYLVEAEENGQTDLAVALTLVNLTNIKDKVEKLDF